MIFSCQDLRLFPRFLQFYFDIFFERSTFGYKFKKMLTQNLK